MHEAGYKIVGVADIHGGLYNEKGFDIPACYRLGPRPAQAAAGFPGGGAKMTGQELLFQPCDILIPAAIENQITSAKRASRADASILCEGANGPTTPPADDVLRQKDSSSFRTFWRMPAA